jgi:predicted metal-dependent hydrolase
MIQPLLLGCGARSDRKKRHRAVRGKSEFKASAREWAARIKAKPTQIRVQRMRNKWASCSPGRWISFSEGLLDESLVFQEYVIVHELLHLRIPNHGKLFKSLMSTYLPGWEKWVGREFSDAKHRR